MGRWHAHYARRQGSRIAAVVDPSPQAAAALARRTPGAATYADLGAMLESVHPRVVHLCTPLASHAALASQAVAAGAHVLVEKPITPTAPEARALLDAARARAVHVCPVHQFAFQRGIARLAARLATLGEPLAATFTICSAGAELPSAASADAILAEMLPHPLSVLQALWPANEVRAADWSAEAARPGELEVRGRSGDMPVHARVSLNARPTRCDLEVLGSEGSAVVNLFHGYAVLRYGAPSRADKATQPFRLAAATLAAAGANLARRVVRNEPAYPGLDALIARFYAAARDSGDNPVSPAQTLAVALVRDHLIRQALPGAA